MSLHALLHVDIEAVVHNWRTLKAQAANANCAAVVKANAYGLGVASIAPALAQAGCRRFFVATLEEGIELRALLPKTEIFVFHGAGEGEENEFIAARLSPVLNSLAQLERWQKAVPAATVNAALHVDTGMCRLGVSEAEALALAQTPKRLQQLRIEFVMSHLTCGGTPAHPKNAEQLQRFNHVRSSLPQIKASLANSSGIFLGHDFHFDFTRPGCSLYGISPNLSLPNPMRQVVTLTAPIIQIRTLERAETVGYEATHTASAGTHLATIGIGYADGVLRALSGKLFVWIEGVRVPVVGRVSMDMIIADISALTPQQRGQAQQAELIGTRQTVDDIATAAGTIGYEVFTRLGPRIHRH